MSEPQQNPGDQASDTSRLSLTRVLTAAGFVGLVAVVLGLLWKLNNAAPAVQNENVELKHQLGNMQEMLADLRRAEQLRTEEEHVRRSDFQATAASADEAARAVAAFEKAAADWERATRELLTTEKGKPIAGNNETLAQFHALWQQPRPGADEPSALRRRLDPLRAVIDKARAANDPGYAPSEEVVTRIKAVRDEAGRGTGAYEDLNRRLAAVVASAPPLQPGAETPTLEAALTQWEQNNLAEQNAAIAAAVERERKERATKLAAAQAQTERELTAAELKAEETKRTIKLREAADEELASKAKAAEAEKARAMALKEAELERKFQAALPEIKSLLSPFITEGFTQPAGESFQQATTKKMKVSFGKIQGSGLLEETPEGVNRLVIAVVANHTNDRPLGSFPNEWTTRYSDPWFKPGQRAQELLIEFGPLMVKKQMLEP